MKAIKGYEGEYSVSPDGRVYSHKSNRFLKHSNHPSGYDTLVLSQQGVVKTQYVHRLVAEAFIPNPDNLATVNHKDADKKNNKVSNLEWMSQKENNHHAMSLGLRGDCKKYDEDTVHRIFKYVMDGWRPVDIAKAIGISTGILRAIMYDKYYRHIRDEYDWDNRPNKVEATNVDVVIRICEFLEGGKKTPEISRILKIDPQIVYRVSQRRSYRQISESFNF